MFKYLDGLTFAWIEGSALIFPSALDSFAIFALLRHMSAMGHARCRLEV